MDYKLDIEVHLYVFASYIFKHSFNVPGRSSRQFKISRSCLVVEKRTKRTLHIKNWFCVWDEDKEMEMKKRQRERTLE